MMNSNLYLRVAGGLVSIRQSSTSKVLDTALIIRKPKPDPKDIH